jgi:hypothetical protein
MTTASVKYPDVTVDLGGEPLTTFGLLIRVVDALREAGREEDVEGFYSAAAACTDHDDVLRLVRATVRTI